MSTMRIPTPAAALLALACIFDTQAAGFDCKAAASASERAICADAGLRQLDARLADAYAKALAASMVASADLRQEQRNWLNERDGCAADIRCLTTQYEQRIAALGMPDQADMEALEALRQAVEAARRTDPEFPLEKALASLKFNAGKTSFYNEEDPDNPSAPARFPRKRPQGVSDAEWRALLASRIESGGENGRANYMLLDLDGDGQRDLVIDAYTGGTGLFNSISALRQSGGRFSVPGARQGAAKQEFDDEPEGSHLYAIGGRGGNQAAEWVRLRGRVYAVYRDSQYGVDQVSLLRPWRGNGRVPRLTIRYRYRLSVPAVQAIGERPASRLAPALHRALNEAVAQAAILADKTPAQPAQPICPVAADAPEDVRDDSFSYGPGHYTIETVADVPVWIGKQCYLGQLRDWFGGYDAKEGLGAQLCMRKPGVPEPSEDECYAVQGPRTVVRMDAGVGLY